MSDTSLKEKTAKGLFWGGFSNGIQQLLNLGFGIVLARLLDASDYGMVGMLTIFSAIAAALQEGGFISALTNRKETLHKDYNAVFWFRDCPFSRFCQIQQIGICQHCRRTGTKPLSGIAMDDNETVAGF